MYASFFRVRVIWYNMQVAERLRLFYQTSAPSYFMEGKVSPLYNPTPVWRDGSNYFRVQKTCVLPVVRFRNWWQRLKFSLTYAICNLDIGGIIPSCTIETFFTLFHFVFANSKGGCGLQELELGTGNDTLMIRTLMAAIVGHITIRMSTRKNSTILEVTRNSSTETRITVEASLLWT